MGVAGLPGLFVPLFLLCAYGWGQVGGWIGDRRFSRFHTLTAVLGLAVLNFLGGCLNLLGWATPPVLMGLLGAGLFLAIWRLRRTRPWRSGGAAVSGFRRAPLWLAIAGAGATAFLLVPTSLFNICDDFYTYAPRVVRMTQTGTLGGDAFDPLGLDSLGSQAFFQGFFLRGLEVRWLNGFDAAACFALCLLIPAELALRWRLSPWVGVLAVLAVAVFNPQCINLSPLYSSAAVIMALVVGGAFLRPAGSAPGGARGGRPAVCFALLLAFLMTLKNTVAFFAAGYAALLLLLLLGRRKDRGAVLRSAGVTAAGVLAVMLPWALVTVPSLWHARQLGREFESGATIAARYLSLAAREIPALFTLDPLFYGDRPPSFGLLVLICAGFAVASGRIGRHRVAAPAGSLSFVAAGLAVPAVYLWNAHLFDYVTAIRYSCPMLLGCTPLILLGYLRWGRRVDAARQRIRVGLVSGALLSVILVFAGTAWARARQMIRDRTLLSFPLDDAYRDYSRRMVSRAELLHTRTLQSRMEPGSVALAWIVAPFHLDFERNRILTASEPGLISPGLRLPAGIEPAVLEDYLRRWGVRYILLEVAGPGIKDLAFLETQLASPRPVYRMIGDYAIYFRRSLVALSRRGRVLHSDGRMLLFELGPTSAPATGPPSDPERQPTASSRGPLH